MPYTILRFKKDKGGAIAGCERHNERKKEAYKSNPDIDITRTKYNYHIIQASKYTYGRKIKELIKKYDSTNPNKGYNLRFGGKNSSFSEETINKFREIRKGTQSGELNNFYGKKHSEETKRKLRENHLNRPSYFKGHKHSIHSKKKISESKKGVLLHDRTSNAKAVIQYSDDNDCIKVWTCIMDAVRYFNGTTTSHIVACCKGKRNKAFGYKWRYLTDER